MTTATTLTRILLLLSALLSLATATTTTLDRSESETKSERRKSGLGEGGSVSPSGEVSSQGLPRSLGIIITAVVTLLGFIIPAVVTLLIIAFLIAGAAFFTCSIVDCGSFTRGRGFNSILDGRNIIHYMDQFRLIYQAFDDGNQKYGSPVKGHGNSGLGSSSGR